MSDKFPRNVDKNKLNLIYHKGLFGGEYCLAQKVENEYIISTGWPLSESEVTVKEKPSWLTPEAMKRLYCEARACSSTGCGIYLDRFPTEEQLLKRLFHLVTPNNTKERPVLNSNLIEQCVERLINSLNLRRGFKELWEKTEPYYRNEIRKEWEEIVTKYVRLAYYRLDGDVDAKTKYIRT